MSITLYNQSTMNFQSSQILLSVSQLGNSWREHSRSNPKNLLSYSSIPLSPWFQFRSPVLTEETRNKTPFPPLAVIHSRYSGPRNNEGKAAEKLTMGLMEPHCLFHLRKDMAALPDRKQLSQYSRLLEPSRWLGVQVSGRIFT